MVDCSIARMVAPVRSVNKNNTLLQTKFSYRYKVKEFLQGDHVFLCEQQVVICDANIAILSILFLRKGFFTCKQSIC